MYDLHAGSMMAVILLLPTVAAYLLQKYWLRKKALSPFRKPPKSGGKFTKSTCGAPLMGCLLVSGIILLFYGTVWWEPCQNLGHQLHLYAGSL